MMNDLISRVNPRLGVERRWDEIHDAVIKVLQSGSYILGPEVVAFEQEFAHYLGSSYGVGVASGTDALVLALKACGIGHGERVVTVPNTAVATVAAIELAGAVPVLIDIDATSQLMDVGQLEELLGTSRNSIAAVLPVHLFGLMVDMRRVMRLAEQYGLVVVEDCAQAHGATLMGKRAGSFGQAGAFSFYPTKNLAAIGDGGFVATEDAEIAHRLHLLRQYGWRERYISEIPGGNSRLDELQAAILRVRLRYLDEENQRRRRIAERYTEGLKDLPIVLPPSLPDQLGVFHQYTILVDQRDTLQGHLEQLGIMTSVLYPVPIHRQPAYAGRIETPFPLTNAERAASQLLCLPMYPELTDDQIDRIIHAIRSFYLRAA